MFEQQLTATGEYARLKAALQSPGAAALFGMQPAGRAVLYAALSAQEHTPLVVVTAGEADAVRMAADLETLGLRAGVFPARDLVLRPVEGAGRELEYRRLKILGELAGGRLDAVCLSAESLLLRTVPPADFRAATLTLRPGMEIAQETLLETLLAAGYLRRPQVDGPGQFSVRGGIVDLYAPDMPAPARIEFWGDEIDTIHSFDLVSQRRDAALEKIYLSPPARCCSETRPGPPPCCAAPPRRRNPPPGTSWSRRWSRTSRCWTAGWCRWRWTNTCRCGMKRPPPSSTICPARRWCWTNTAPSGKRCTARPSARRRRSRHY